MLETVYGLKKDLEDYSSDVLKLPHQFIIDYFVQGTYSHVC